MINSFVEFVRVALKGNGIFSDLINEALHLWAISQPGVYISSCCHYKCFVRVTTLLFDPS